MADNVSEKTFQNMDIREALTELDKHPTGMQRIRHDFVGIMTVVEEWGDRDVEDPEKEYEYAGPNIREALSHLIINSIQESHEEDSRFPLTIRCANSLDSALNPAKFPADHKVREDSLALMCTILDHFGLSNDERLKFLISASANTSDNAQHPKQPMVKPLMGAKP